MVCFGCWLVRNRLNRPRGFGDASAAKSCNVSGSAGTILWRSRRRRNAGAGRATGSARFERGKTAGATPGRRSRHRRAIRPTSPPPGTGKTTRLADSMRSDTSATRGCFSPWTRSTFTVAIYFRRWLADSVEVTVSRRTCRDYRDKVENHIIPVLGRKKLEDLTTMTSTPSTIVSCKKGTLCGRSAT